ncbi:hypothetical protein BDF20DRAFT_875278 [Mycotypha africana]|uniref:uncharacterized protein n=1 Tax=Mycotypha africana TaxID=64632 RepID=UPI0023001935|nr:uncharacterized protein BDF20DRAFT_875278 [Mycotypha africana]KAI8977508.1 hypothetical protein BDF20DRAFT_875278 [Mycotypha africana]
MMNATMYYKKRRLRQKPNILTYEQQQELSKLIVGKKSTSKTLTDQGLLPTSLFRLRKRKLECLYDYLLKHDLIHCGDKEHYPIESVQTHQLAEYLLAIIYPGYPACRAKNLAFTDYRECREREATTMEDNSSSHQPLAYDFVPTTEIFDRLDEIIRVDVDDMSSSHSSTTDQQKQHKPQDDCGPLTIPFPPHPIHNNSSSILNSNDNGCMTSSSSSSSSLSSTFKVIYLSVSSLRKSIDRVRSANPMDTFSGHAHLMEYHLCFWNSTRTLVKPHCKSLKLQSKEIWTEKDEKMVQEGFMHVDITQSLLYCLSTMKTQKDKSPFLTLMVELMDHEEQNINHVSISAVARKPIQEFICQLYLQTTTECMAKALRKSQHPLDTQKIILHLLKQYDDPQPSAALKEIDDSAKLEERDMTFLSEKLRRAETLFMTCTSNSNALFPSNSDSSSQNHSHSHGSSHHDDVDKLNGSMMNSLSTTSEEDYDDEDEGELVSFIDPLSCQKQRIQHPIKSVHCRHRTCFDAASFLRHNMDKKIWHCPICFVHIKNFEDLRMDYPMKVALREYAKEEELYLFGDNSFVSVNEYFVMDANRVDDEEEEKEEEEEEADYIELRLENESIKVDRTHPTKKAKTLHVM